jgi:hypothetical protein
MLRRNKNCGGTLGVVELEWSGKMPHGTKSGWRLRSDANADTEVDVLIAAGIIRELTEPIYPGGPLITHYQWIGVQDEPPQQ